LRRIISNTLGDVIVETSPVVTGKAQCAALIAPNGLRASINDSPDFSPALATVAVLGRRPCEFQWRRCKATDRHYVVGRINMFRETRMSGAKEKNRVMAVSVCEPNPRKSLY
jgi:hypothetical protein